MVAESAGRMASLEDDAERRASLAELSEQLSAQDADEEPKPRSCGVLSISIDIAGSTQAKTRMRAKARDSDELTEWYRRFHRQFVEYEWWFYEALFRDEGNRTGLDWRRTFVVKGIGDEVWVLYEVLENDEWNLPALAVRLIDSALEVSGRRIFWTSAQDKEDEYCEQEQPESTYLPFKVYVDLVEDAFEIATPRLEYLSDRIRGFFGSEESWRDGESVHLANRLNAGTLMVDGRRLLATTRTDYIGWEVDRFFRLTKFAIPGVVTVGANLFQRILQSRI